jgi:hypothetical protein
MDLLVVIPDNRMKDGPHDLRKVYSALVISNIQAKDDLAKL